ncbi:MAG: hypothetical protein IPK59_08235 [Rhodospirillaceae bacterium]|nr:hypothetical protein [Rhodospirillaceae bacterium]
MGRQIKETLWQLFRPVAYLRIEHPAKKLFDVTAPKWLAVGTTVILTVLPNPPLFLGEGSVLEQIQSLIQLLIGFFIAALAAIATFDEKSLDCLMEGTPATLKQPDPYQGRPTDNPLTRRQFLCFLYGYLSFLSFALYLAIMALQILQPSFDWLAKIALPLGPFAPVSAMDTVAAVLKLGYGFFFWQMVTVTLMGLYYLTDRLNRERSGDPE